MEEVWKDVIGCENRYQISSYGRIMAKEKTRLVSEKETFYKKHNTITHRAKMLKQMTSKRGYLCINLYVGNSRKCFMTHKLVASHFLSNKDNHPIVNHKNGDKLDNYVENLEWCTYSHNNKHAARILQNMGCRKLTAVQVNEIRNECSGLTHYEIADRYNISRQNVGSILSNNSWKNLQSILSLETELINQINKEK